jgi:hypothetical protein
MKELIKSNWNYILHEKDGRLILSVVCGGVALFEREIVLNKEEQSAFEKHGQEYLNTLADAVRNNPVKFENRDKKNKKLNKHQKNFLYYLELYYRNFGGIWSIDDFPRQVKDNFSKIEPIMDELKEKGIIKQLDENGRFQVLKLPSEFYD